jgi:hypothetical protein
LWGFDDDQRPDPRPQSLLEIFELEVPSLVSRGLAYPQPGRRQHREVRRIGRCRQRDGVAGSHQRLAEPDNADDDIGDQGHLLAVDFPTHSPLREGGERLLQGDRGGGRIAEVVAVDRSSQRGCDQCRDREVHLGDRPRHHVRLLARPLGAAA